MSKKRNTLTAKANYELKRYKAQDRKFDQQTSTLNFDGKNGSLAKYLLLSAVVASVLPVVSSKVNTKTREENQKDFLNKNMLRSSDARCNALIEKSWNNMNENQKEVVATGILILMDRVGHDFSRTFIKCPQVNDKHYMPTYSRIMPNHIDLNLRFPDCVVKSNKLLSSAEKIIMTVANKRINMIETKSEEGNFDDSHPLQLKLKEHQMHEEECFLRQSEFQQNLTLIINSINIDYANFPKSSRKVMLDIIKKNTCPDEFSILTKYGRYFTISTNSISSEIYDIFFSFYNSFYRHHNKQSCNDFSLAVKSYFGIENIKKIPEMHNIASFLEKHDIDKIGIARNGFLSQDSTERHEDSFVTTASKSNFVKKASESFLSKESKNELNKMFKKRYYKAETSVGK